MLQYICTIEEYNRKFATAFFAFMEKKIHLQFYNYVLKEKFSQITFGSLYYLC